MRTLLYAIFFLNSLYEVTSKPECKRLYAHNMQCPGPACSLFMTRNYPGDIDHQTTMLQLLDRRITGNAVLPPQEDYKLLCKGFLPVKRRTYVTEVTLMQILFFAIELTTSSSGALNVGFTSEKKNDSKSTGILAACVQIKFKYNWLKHYNI